MKVKLVKVINSVNALNKLSSQVTHAKTAFRLAKILNAISEEVDVFENTKKQLIKNRLEEGQTQLTESQEREVKEELIKLIQEEVEIPFQPLPIGEIAAVSITIQDMMAIDYIFEG